MYIIYNMHVHIVSTLTKIGFWDSITNMLDSLSVDAPANAGRIGHLRALLHLLRTSA